MTWLLWELTEDFMGQALSGVAVEHGELVELAGKGSVDVDGASPERRPVRQGLLGRVDESSQFGLYMVDTLYPTPELLRKRFEEGDFNQDTEGR